MPMTFAVLNVNDIEAELTYNDLSATFTMNDYEVLNWAYRADWKDGSTTFSVRDNTPTHYNDKSYRLRSRGAAQVWFSHSYQTANSEPGYQVDLIDSGQIAGKEHPDGEFTHRFPQTLRVWERVPVSEIAISAPKVKPGEEVALTISLDGNAPRCGTIVLLKFPADLFAHIPPQLVVLPFTQKIEVRLVVHQNAPRGKHQLKAWTAESQRDNPPKVTLTVL